MRLPLRIAIVDGQPRFREGVRSLLHLQPDLIVVTEIDRLEAVAAVLALTPCDVVLLYLDVSLLHSLPRVRAIADRVALIAVIAAGGREDGLAVIRAGARGVLFERFAIDALVEAIRTVAAGHVWVPPALQTYMVGQLGDPFDGVLTAREREITRCVACGLRNGEVAEQLAISEQTVKKHLNRIFHKLGVRDRVELVLQAGGRDLGGEPLQPFGQPGLPGANGQAIGSNGVPAVGGTRRARRDNGRPADRVVTKVSAVDVRKTERVV